VLGLVNAETLHSVNERHLRCNPTLAQFIVHDDFTPELVEGDFDKRRPSSEFVRQREQRVTRAWKRLREIARNDQMSVLDHPLP
jgi:hypothetical protein